MRREEAWDALEQAQTMDAKIRPKGRWYAVYCFGYGLASLIGLLVMGVPGTVLGMVVGSCVLAAMIVGLSFYQLGQPVKPLGYGKLHVWGISLWGAVYSLTLVVGMTLFQGDPAWWVPMALLSAVPTSVAGVIVLRQSRSQR